jgi:mRNA-degrading endonuclease HigB of HigAB toxin-antitoxin module
LRVIGVDHIHEFIGTQPPGLAGQVLAWLNEASSARWHSLADLRKAYPFASTAGDYIIFLVCGRRIAITTLVLFQIHVVVVTHVQCVENQARPLERRHS